MIANLVASESVHCSRCLDWCRFNIKLVVKDVLFVVNEEVIYDVTVDRQDFIVTLENNLPIYEKNELYEECAEIVKGIKFLKEKQK